jgi:hypothetical protein
VVRFIAGLEEASHFVGERRWYRPGVRAPRHREAQCHGYDD